MDGIGVLSFFSNGISVILILTCGTAVSFSPAGGFSSFCPPCLVKEDPSQYCETVHCVLPSNASQYF